MKYPNMNGTELGIFNNNINNYNDTPTTHVGEEDRFGCLSAFIIRCVLIGMFCILGLIGNVTAFCVFQLDTLKTSTTFLFQSLCITDSFLLLFVLPLYCLEAFVIYTELWLSSLYTIQPFIYVYIFPWSEVAHCATIWLTVLVGVNRFIAVCVPYKAARLCTASKAKQYVAIVIIASIIYNIPRFLAFKVITTNNYNYPEYTALGKNRPYRIIYENICYLIFMLCVPLLILTVLNTRLIKTLKDLKRRRAEMQTRQQQQDNNVTIVLVVVVLVFSVCQIPSLINHVVWTLSVDDETRTCGGVHFYLRHMSNLLVVINSATNFIIYILFNTRFRSLMMQRVFRVKCRNNRGATSNGASQTLLSKI